MKYAKEVINLMGCMPGRRFKMREIVRSVAPKASVRQRSSIRISVHRVMRALEESGQVESTRAETINGADAEYWWKTVTRTSCEPYHKPLHYQQAPVRL